MWRALCRASGAIAVGSLLPLGVVAQASAQDIRNFAEIQGGPVVVTPDPGGRSATLEVDTTIDVACSVIYGEDESYGHIAVDSDMDGGAHNNHHPVMSGLVPDTEYVYRFQGAAPDGVIYVSEVFSFRTPPEPVGGLSNLALDATVVGVSSEFSDAFRAEHAFDGYATTEWSSRGDGDDAWVEIDLGASVSVSQVLFRTRSMSDGSSITRSFSVTVDGVELGQFGADELVSMNTEARILRFDVVTSSGGNTGAVDILVFGTAAAAP